MMAIITSTATRFSFFLSSACIVSSLISSPSLSQSPSSSSFSGLPHTDNKPSSREVLVASQCVGGLIGLGCSPGHRIRVQRDWYGVGTDPDVCGYSPGDCRVINRRHVSVVHRYCEGQQVCSNFLVDRRHCGINETTYEQVEYVCVPAGYLATPNFPSEYPPLQHCTCNIHSRSGVGESDDMGSPGSSSSSSFSSLLGDGAERSNIRLDFTHFLVKYDHPCRDYIEIRVRGRSKRLCGSRKMSVIGSNITVVFHSDGANGHQGVWGQFANEQDASGHRPSLPIIVQCGPTQYSPFPSPTEPDSLSSSPSAGRRRVTVKDAKNHPSSSLGGSEGDYEEGVGGGEQEEEAVGGGEDLREEEEALVQWYADEYRFYDVINMTSQSSGSFVRPLLQSSQQMTTASTERHGRLLDPYFLGEVRRRAGGGPVGLTVVFVCVGCVVGLLVILLVVLAVNKTRNSTSSSRGNDAKKDHIQQQLQSLSFYDSIPIYDSLSRKGGVARAVPMAAPMPRPSLRGVGGSAGSRVGAALALKGKSHQHNVHRTPSSAASSFNKTSVWNLEGPYWVTMRSNRGGGGADPQDSTSDRESSAYTELDKISSSTRTSTLLMDGMAGGSGLSHGTARTGGGGLVEAYMGTSGGGARDSRSLVGGCESVRGVGRGFSGDWNSGARNVALGASRGQNYRGGQDYRGAHVSIDNDRDVFTNV